MKRIIIYFAIGLSLGCKKDPAPFKGHMKLTIDGRYEEFNEKLIARVVSGNSVNILGEASYGALEIKVYNAAIGDNVIAQNPGSQFIHFTLWDLNNQTASYASGGGLSVGSSSGNINFSEINNDYVKGTFSFVTEKPGATLQPKTVTNGSFHIKTD